jgi:hypothetical protein
METDIRRSEPPSPAFEHEMAASAEQWANCGKRRHDDCLLDGGSGRLHRFTRDERRYHWPAAELARAV